MNEVALERTFAMSLHELMRDYLVGSHEGYSWEDERDALLGPSHVCRTAELILSIAKHGIHTPIMLGSDGRIWDGHHRIIAAWCLGLDEVPVFL